MSSWVPAPGKRHAAGYMEPGESRDYLALMKQRQAAGLPPDPRMGSEREEMLEPYEDDDDDQEGETGAVGLLHWAANQSFWGRFLKLFGR